MTWGRVPNELWLEVFKTLPRENLKDVSLTFHLFCRITRPLLFTHFDFHPYCIGANGALLLPQKEHVDMALERLNFWFSDEIAPSVRSCTVVPWRPVARQSTWRFSSSETPHVLLDVFFDRLASFTGLQRMDTVSVYFTQTAITNLCLLSALATLRIQRFMAPDDDAIDVTSTVLAVSSFTIQNNITAEDGLAHWIALLRPDSLRELSVHCNLRFFGDHIDNVPCFSQVQMLSITLNFAIMSHNLNVLRKFPNVETLSISGWGELGECSRNPGVLWPVLTEYIDSQEPLALILPCPHLKRLTIHYCSPDDLLLRLHSVSGPLNITSLVLDFDSFDNEKFASLCSVVGAHLHELKLAVTVQVDDSELDEDEIQLLARTFFEALASTPSLPSVLEHLAISWLFESGEEFEPGDEAPDNFSELDDTLVARCPKLKSLWLDGHGFLFHWRQTADGTAEHFADNLDEAEDTRKGFAAFWAAR
ncbi:hypothetical protein B0H16DRAFT_1618636 [Mycena metata]|uniref:F-box domain-containing protein n=1 Tax=Mycena metata TaxID=1033252 RepID=A0AAD7H7T8_9AGAR|nr:hypothetical protein B0H16DRAFT_1618636 [Mycena metata]